MLNRNSLNSPGCCGIFGFVICFDFRGPDRYLMEKYEVQCVASRGKTGVLQLIKSNKLSGNELLVMKVVGKYILL